VGVRTSAAKIPLPVADDVAVSSVILKRKKKGPARKKKKNEK
jgi:hypothetical protein